VFSDLAFFSLVSLSDPEQHRPYNEWHQLDHRPENLALPGVAWGDRWARAEFARSEGHATAEYRDVDYLAMYWFRQPLEASLRSWDDLGGDSFQWGRGPIIPGVDRKLLAFFRPVKGYTAPRVLVDADVLPFRPNRGIHVTLTKFDEPHGFDAHARFAWEDRTLMPALSNIEGVAGGWLFAFSHAQKHATLPLEGSADVAPGGLRMRLLYLDGDPAIASSSIASAERQLESEERPLVPSSSKVLFQSTFTTIIPWQDW
jgi:hypothetical protein